MTAPQHRLDVTPPSRYGDRWQEYVASFVAEPPASILEVEPGDTVLVVGAHPDDETFGVGATLADLAAAGIDVHVVALTEGEAAVQHLGIAVPGSAARRRQEFHRACAALGVTSARVLDLPDAGLSQHPRRVQSTLAGLLAHLDADTLLATWWEDPHSDHAALGQAALRVACHAGCGVFGYPIWAQHWTDPDHVFKEAHTVTRPMTTTAARSARAAAIADYTSQTSPLTDDLHPILPADMLAWDVELLVKP